MFLLEQILTEKGQALAGMIATFSSSESVDLDAAVNFLNGVGISVVDQNAWTVADALVANDYGNLFVVEAIAAAAEEHWIISSPEQFQGAYDSYGRFGLQGFVDYMSGLEGFISSEFPLGEKLRGVWAAKATLEKATEAYQREIQALSHTLAMTRVHHA